MGDSLVIRGLTKQLDDFYLDHIDITVPGGSVVGFIGENGSGKTTTIKLAMNLMHQDSGEVLIFPDKQKVGESQIKEQIGVVFDESHFPELINAKELGHVMKDIYETWNEARYTSYLAQFSISTQKKIKDYSRGMKMKLQIAVALSHDTKLLILDEATSGLDPVVRDEMLDVFRDFIQDEEHSIFMSSHITSDLEKIADTIVFIHKGKIVLTELKDSLLDDYGILKCSHSQYEGLNRDAIIGSRKNKFGVEALIKRGTINPDRIEGNYVIDAVDLDEIMLFYNKGVEE